MASFDKRPNGKWRAQVRRQGMGVASRNFVSKKAAEKWARETEALIECGSYQKAKTKEKAVTLGTLVERYRGTVTVKKKSYKQETYILNAFLRHKLCNKKIEDVSTADWIKYRDERLKEIKPVSVKRVMAIFSNVYVLAKNEWGYSELSNPISSVRVEYTDNKRGRTLKGDEWERIVAEAKTRKNPIILAVIQWAKETGCRRSEILRLKWDHVDLKERVVTIADSKNGEARVLPITKAMLAILEAQEPDNDLVFPIGMPNFSTTWNSMLKKLGLYKSLRLHDLRHHAVTEFFSRGLNVIEVASLSGHKELKMLQRYTHPRPADILKKLEAVA
jgi:integrase